jgi:hypothetical protein
MLEQPDELARGAGGHRVGTGVHRRDGVLVGNRAIADRPFNRRRAVLRLEAERQVVTRGAHICRSPKHATILPVDQVRRQGPPDWFPHYSCG